MKTSLQMNFFVILVQESLEVILIKQLKSIFWRIDESGSLWKCFYRTYNCQYNFHIYLQIIADHLKGRKSASRMTQLILWNIKFSVSFLKFTIFFRLAIFSSESAENCEIFKKIMLAASIFNHPAAREIQVFVHHFSRCLGYFRF